MQLNNIDWLIIASFFVFSLLIGVIVSRKSGKNITIDLNHTINDFFDYYLKNKNQFKYDDFISKYETEVLNK